jgi:hypothetical protein
LHAVRQHAGKPACQDCTNVFLSALPAAYYLACRVQIGCRWILMDATWDRPLGRDGFMVNDQWDGYSETRCTVKRLNSQARTAFCPILKKEPCRVKGDPELCSSEGEKNHWDSEDQARDSREKVSVRKPDEVERITQFNHDFDAWLNDVRQQK